MAKISSSFKCMLCKEPLNFPNNISIVDFMILVLNFYKTHDQCEIDASQNKIDSKLKKKK